MDTKKTIIVSIITTLATMFVVAVLIHLCHCGGGRCYRQQSCNNGMMQQCMYNHGGGHGQCAAYASCHGKSCSGNSKCSKGKSCTGKSKCSMGADNEWTNENGDKVIKKVIKVDVDDKK